MADDWNSLQSTFGLSAQDIASLKTQGMNPNSATDFLTQGIKGVTNASGQGIMEGPGGMSLSQLINLGSMFGGKGGGGTSGQNQSGGLRNYQTVGVDPNQPMTNLGAAALQQNAVYNPQPGAGTGGDTGVTGSGGSGFAGGGGLTIGGVSTTQPRITTSGVVPTAPKGPWNDVPSLFNKAPTMQPTAPLPVTPTPQATGVPYRPGQSWATPPPAPGITFGGGSVPMPIGGGGQQGVPQNWQGAGQVAPSGIPSGGGVAGSAIALGTAGQPAPYTGTVHNDPYMSNAVSKLMGLASNPWHPEGGSSTTTASPANPIKMRSGGWVPGDPNDNTDSVPAQLSPGEYVIPKPTERPQQMRSSSAYSPPPAPSDQQSGQQSTQSPAASTHTDDRAGTATIANLGKLYAGTQTNAAQNAQMLNTGGVQGQPYVGPAGPGVTDRTYQGANTGQMGSAIGGAIGSIGSALQSALANVPSWKVQASAIPDPSSFKKQQTQYNLQTPSA